VGNIEYVALWLVIGAAAALLLWRAIRAARSRRS
jgi:hypothetical protein